MAKRRTKEQIKADKIIRKNLNILGEKIIKQAKKITRVRTGRLKQSINFRVQPDTVLTLTQWEYGKDVHPTKQYDKGEPDALLITAKELVPPGVEVIKKDLIESIMYPFREGKAK